MGLFHKSWLAAAVVAVAVAIGTGSAIAESGGSSGTINGTVLDPSGAVVANANVEIRQAVSGYDQTATTDSKGSFTFVNVPFNPYHMTVTAAGFASSVQDVDVRSIVPVSVSVSLTVAGKSDTVTVEDTGDLVENDPTSHVDVDKQLMDRLPMGSGSSTMSGIVGKQRRASLPTPTARSTDSATTRRIRSTSTTSRILTSTARRFRTRFPSTRFNPWKSSRARRRRNMAARPAW